jgi:hypothetical protein
MGARWRKQMFEPGDRGGALQQTTELVEVASREPTVPKGDWDGWVVRRKGSSIVVRDVHGPIVTGVLGGD